MFVLTHFFLQPDLYHFTCNVHFLPDKKPNCGLTFLAGLTVLQAYLFLFYPVPFCLMAATVVKNVAYANDASAMIPEFVSSSHQPDNLT